MNLPIALVIISWAAVLAATPISSDLRTWRRPTLTMAVCGVTGAGLLMQLAQPMLLARLERNTHEMLQGEWWRAFTALLVQDGWLLGGLTNVCGLLLIGGRAEQLYGRLEWTAIYFGGALITEGVAMAWQPVGAGNSVAVCALAGGLAASQTPTAGRSSALILRATVFASALLLLVFRDIHGVAILAGTGLKSAFSTLRRRT